MLFIVGCTTQTQSPILELTINENECSFEGPNTIPNNEFMVKLTLNEKTTGSGYALVTLEGVKTSEDLKAWPSADQP